MKNILLYVVIGLAIAYFIYNKRSAASNGISAQILRSKLNTYANIGLIDVRSESEYNGSVGHVKGSTLVPLPELSNRLDEIKSKNYDEVYVICLSGSRSASAVKTLSKNGIDAQNVIGGMMAWNKLK